LISSSPRNHTILEGGLEFRAIHSIKTSWFSCTSNFEPSDVFIMSMDEGGAVQKYSVHVLDINIEVKIKLIVSTLCL